LFALPDARFSARFGPASRVASPIAMRNCVYITRNRGRAMLLRKTNTTRQHCGQRCIANNSGEHARISASDVAVGQDSGRPRARRVNAAPWKFASKWQLISVRMNGPQPLICHFVPRQFACDCLRPVIEFALLAPRARSRDQRAARSLAKRPCIHRGAGG